MAQFEYTHNESIRFTLGNGHSVILSQGKIYNLPENNSYIASLVGQGFLKPVEEVKKQTRKRTPKSSKS